MPSFLERIAKSVLTRLFNEGIIKIFKKERRKETESLPTTHSEPIKSNSPSDKSERSHPWRLCPLGESWVRTHPLTVPASEKGPEWETIPKGHCRKNKSGRNVPAIRKKPKIGRNNGKTQGLLQAPKRKTGFQIISLSVSFICCFLSVTVLSVKPEGHTKVTPPQFLLTPHFGVLSSDELKTEAQKNGNFFWQCFPTQSVSITFDKWRDTDPMGSSNQIVTMCLFEVTAKYKGIWSEFTARRANRIEVCTSLIDNWKRLTKGEDFVCIGGEGLEFEKKAPKKGRHSWTWIKFKTKKGCYAYFADDCN